MTNHEVAQPWHTDKETRAIEQETHKVVFAILSTFVHNMTGFEVNIKEVLFD